MSRVTYNLASSVLLQDYKTFQRHV